VHDLDTRARELARPVLGPDGQPVRDRLTFGNRGYWLKLSSASHNAQADGAVSLSAAMHIMNADGQKVGETNRSITVTSDGRISAYNALMSITRKEDRQGGFATAFNRYMEDWYIANSEKTPKVTVSAAMSNGGFAWAMNGFRWQGSKAQQIQKARNYLATMERRAGAPADREQIMALKRKLDSGVAVSPLEVGLVGWRPGMGGSDSWIGKEILNGSNWSGQKDLKPNDWVVVQNQAYQDARVRGERARNGENVAEVDDDFVQSLQHGMLGDNLRNSGMSPAEVAEVQRVVGARRSLATLPVATREKLRKWATERANRVDIPVENLPGMLALQRAAWGEFVAERPARADLGVGEELRDARIADMRSNNVPGWQIRRLAAGGINSDATFKAVHRASGQVFFIKADTFGGFGGRRSDSDGRNAEVDANRLVRGAGMAGVAAAEPSRVEPTVFISQRVGDALGLVARPENAMNLTSQPGASSRAPMANPADVFRMLVFDSVIANRDRHRGNWQGAVDADGNWHIFPIDHGISGGGNGWIIPGGAAPAYLRSLLGITVQGDSGRLNGERVQARELYTATFKRFLKKYGADITRAELLRAIAEFRASNEALGRDGFEDDRFYENVSLNLDALTGEIDEVIDGLSRIAGVLPGPQGLAQGGAGL
jgi:hypothetical protein